MKYIITIFVTAVIVFLGATVYYKGLPEFGKPTGVSIISVEEGIGLDTNSTASPSAALSGNQELAGEMKALFVSKYGVSAESWDVKVASTEGNFAKGSVNTNEGGGMWFAAKINGIWKLIWDGNGVIECDKISPYPTFPEEMIPECYSTASGKLITR